MKFLGCSGTVTFDTQQRPMCSSGWTVHTTEQLYNEISVNGNTQALTPEVYSALQLGMGLILLAAFGWRVSYKLFDDDGDSK